MRKSVVALALAGVLALPTMGAASILVNGGFEDNPGVTDLVNGSNFANMPAGSGTGSWGVWDTLPGWRTVSGAGIEVQTAPTVGTINPHGGNYYVELDSHANTANGGATNSTMAQTVNLLAGTYELSFWYSPRTGNQNDNGIQYSIAGLIGVADGPSAVAPVTSVGMWTNFLLTFNVATAGAYDLSFAAIGSQNTFGGYIDDVSLSAVPLPASILLLLGGLGGLGLARRRRGTA